MREPSTPKNDKAHGEVGQVGEHQSRQTDCANTCATGKAFTPHSAQALRVISGEQAAHDYLARLQAQRVQVDELAATVAMLSDAVSLVGFCRAIEKALGVRS